MTHSALLNDLQRPAATVHGRREPVRDPYCDSRMAIMLSTNPWEPYEVEQPVSAEEQGRFLSKERQNALNEMDAAGFS